MGTGNGDKFMKILYGTTNNGKLQAMKNAVKDLDIEIIGLNDINSELPNIYDRSRPECGTSR